MKKAIKRRMTEVTPKIAALFLVLTLLSSSAISQPIGVIAIDPADTTVDLNDTFDIDIVIDDSILGLKGFNIQLTFDTTILRLDTVLEGLLLPSVGNTFWKWRILDHDTIAIEMADAILGPGLVINGSGVLATLTFEAISYGVSPLDFVSITLRDSYNGNIPCTSTAGIVRVGVSPSAKFYKEQALSKLNDVYPTGMTKVDKKLAKAIKYIEESLDDKLWLDENHLNINFIVGGDDAGKRYYDYDMRRCDDDDEGKQYGEIVFDKEKKAAKELMNLMKKNYTPQEVKEVCQVAIDNLIEADGFLAKTVYDEAQVYAGDPKVDHELRKADKEIGKAEKEINKGHYDKTIKHYKKAWKHVQRALKYATYGKNIPARATREPDCRKGLTQNEEDMPKDCGFSLSYPNPFNGGTEIHFQIPEAGHVALKIYNTLGQEIRTLEEGQYEAGHHTACWDLKDRHGNVVPNGVYFYRLAVQSVCNGHIEIDRASGHIFTKKIVLVR